MADVEPGGPALTGSQAAAYGHLLLLGPARAGYFATPSQMPGALIEPLFITDPFEGSIAASVSGQDAIAAGLAQAVRAVSSRHRPAPGRAHREHLPTTRPAGERRGQRPGALRVLVVEDDDGIAEPLAEGLTREGFEVSRVATGADALSARRRMWSCWIWACPTWTGTTCASSCEPGPTVPILVVTARGAEVDRVVGLELGADDYIVKPFGFRELVARIRAVMRRSAEPAPARTGPGTRRPDRRSPVPAGPGRGREVTLSPKEFDLLALLAEDPGAVVSRQTILEEVWDPHWYGPTKTVDVHVASLRRKLGRPEWIETVRRVGLRLGDTRSLGLRER